MGALRPPSFERLLARALAEFPAHRSVFGLPRRSFWRGVEGLDLSAPHPGGPAGTPLGVAAGPHTQLAHNIVVGWLAGARTIELKTVQVRDRLAIPRPCIDAEDVGYNVEWSQELAVAASTEQYVVAWALIHLLHARGIPGGPGPPAVRFEASVGYDLAGLRSEKVARFLDTLADAGPLLARLRDRLPRGLRAPADLEAPSRIVEVVTLSTFHGCPPEEIEAMVEHLFARHRLHVVVKFNPTLLGHEAVDGLLHGDLGYDEIVLDREAFARDPRWETVLAMMARLAAVAARHGLTLGAKFANTLVVRNTRGRLPGDVVYLSGPPLHPLAVALAARFAEATGGRHAIAFSGGVDAENFADTVACGLSPVTTCTDLLKPTGYRRLPRYLKALVEAMRGCGARDLLGLIAARAGEADAPRTGPGAPTPDPDARHAGAAARAGAHPGPAVPPGAGAMPAGALPAAALRNLADYARRLPSEPRYRAEAHRAVMPRRGRLALLDCASCNNCTLVCPNGAFFALPIAPVGIETWDLVVEDGVARPRPARFEIAREAQWVLHADLCNDCGNCDPFCPEEGGPFRVKPRLYDSAADFAAAAPGDGILIEAEGRRLLARLDGRAYELAFDGSGARFSDGVIEVRLDPAHRVVSARALEPRAGHVLPLGRYHALRLLGEAVRQGVNPVSAAWLPAAEAPPASP